MGKKNKFRLFGIFNPFDVLLVALLVLLARALDLYAAPQHAQAGGDVAVRFELELYDMPEGFYREINERGTGLAVIEGVRGFGIGTVARAYGEPFLADAPDTSGARIARARVDGREVTHVVVEARATVTEYAIMVGAFQLRTGMETSVRNLAFAGQAIVGAIEIEIGNGGARDAGQ